MAVKNWQQFDTIKARLAGNVKFTASPEAAQRLYYRYSDAAQSYPLDIIPFRGVEQPPNIVAWPPDMKVLINVAGYGEAIAAAMQVQVDDSLVVQVASLPGLAVLKLFAWLGRGEEDSKDAQDLATIFRQYAAAGNLDRLFGDEIGLMEKVDYSLDLAGPRLLGRDVRMIAAPQTLGRIFSLFDNSAIVDRLITHMAMTLRGAEEPVTATQRLVDQFKAGLAGQ